MSDTTSAELHPRPAGYFRWVVCGLLFFGTTINYIDRQVIGVLKTTLKTDLGDLSLFQAQQGDVK